MKTFFSKILFTGLLIVLSNFNILAQVSFNKNLVLPDTNRSLAAISDMVFANNKLFAYTAGGIMVFDENLNFLQEIPFPDLHYGKFTPLIYFPKLWVDDANVLTVKETLNDTAVFAVTPDLNIIRVETSPPYQLTVAVDRAPILDSIKPMNSNNLLRYDNIHKRLFWVIQGRSKDHNMIGNFHGKSRYLAIFKDLESNYNDKLKLIYKESRTYIPNSPDSIYEDRNISDLKFNVTNNYYYLSKLGRIDTWEINNNEDTAVLKRMVNVDSLLNQHCYKFGKMLYVNDSAVNMHKIVAVPVSYGGAGFFNTKNYAIIVLNADSLDAPVQKLSVPNIQILDATILPENHDLLVAFSPNPRFMANTFSGDVAVYHYNSSTGLFDTIPDISFSTNHTVALEKFDFNASFKLFNINQNEILINKKDELVKLTLGNENNYSNNQVYSGKNNYFMKTIRGNNNIYVANIANNAIELFDSTLNHIKTVRTGFSVYHVKADPTGHYLCFYNKHTTSNSTLFIFNTHDTTLNTVEGLSQPIGDCIFNRFAGKFLVCENTHQTPNLIVIDPASATIENTVSITNGTGEIVKYATELFLSDHKDLYVTVNMDVNSISNPSVYIFDAQTLQFKNSINCQVQLNNDSAQYYNAHFAYSAEDSVVYMSIFPQKISFNPYNSEYNNLVDFTLTHNSLLLSLRRDSLIDSIPISGHPAGKIIIPYLKSQENKNNSSQFAGEIFILSDSLIEVNIDQNIFKYHKTMIDLIYDSDHDVMYGLADEQAEISNRSNRKAVVYKIQFVNKVLTFFPVKSFLGQASTFFYNQFDKRIYVQMKFDNYKLGEKVGYLASFAASDTSLTSYDTLHNSQYKQNRSYYTELDHNHDYHFYTNYMTTPYVNPFNNKIYLPNGGHSNVSMVNFTPDETLLLKPCSEKDSTSFTWVSFPRAISSYPTVDTTIGGDNIEPNSDPYKYQLGSYLENLPIGDSINNTIKNEYDGSSWPTQNQYLTNIDARFGYKLSLKYNTNPNQDIKLHLHGNVLPPATTLDSLAGGNKENWVGYWLYQEQDIFDALGSTANQLNMIKHQDWTCSKQLPAYGYDSTACMGCWICDHKITNIKYGDMVVLVSNYKVTTFQWSLFGNALSSRKDLSPEYYSYDEKEDYKPVTVELESGDHPQEIGAFVGDSCVGATALAADDTMTVIRAYVENDGDTITFQKYYGSTKSTDKRVVDEYFVYNPRVRGWQKGLAVNRKGKDRFFVSFKKKKTILPGETGEHNPVLRLFPNPARNSLTVEYRTDGNTMMEIYDITGKRLSVRHEGQGQMKGMRQVLINTGKLKNGIYLLRLTTGTRTGVKRFVIKR